MVKNKTKKTQTDSVLDEGFSESIIDKAKQYVKLVAKIKSDGEKVDVLKKELLTYVSKNGVTAESGTVSMEMAGKKFSVISSISEVYDAKGIHKVFEAKGMDKDKIDLALPFTRKVDTSVIEGMINAEQIDLEDIKSFIKEVPKKPFIKMTAGK